MELDLVEQSTTTATPWDWKKDLLKQFQEEIIGRYDEIEPHLLKYRYRYKTTINSRIKIKSDDIKKSIVVKALEDEKRELDFRLDSLKTPTFLSEIDKNIENISKIVNELDDWIAEINFCRECKSTLKRKIVTIDRNIYKIKSKIHYGKNVRQHIANIQRTLGDLKNRHEAFTRLEGQMFLENENTRKMIANMLYERETFNKLWTKMSAKLNRDKWYLIDIFEYAMSTFDNSIDLYDLLKNIRSKFSKREYDLIMSVFGNEEDVYDRATGIHSDLKDEEEKRKIDIYNILRKFASDEDACKFIKMKTRMRESAGIEPMMYEKCRETTKNWYKDACELYKTILEKVLPSGTETLSTVIEKCDEQESFRYSYYVYMSNVNHQVVNLQQAINDLYQQIDVLRNTANKRINVSLKNAENTEKQYEKEKRTTDEKIQNKVKADQRLQNIFKGILDLTRKANCDLQLFNYYLGDYSKITIFNIKNFLKVLQNQINFIIYAVYITRRDDRLATAEYANEPSALDDIIAVHQCPECAERDDVIYDFGPTNLMTMEEIRLKMYKKVRFPNMRERLHSISQCTMPRSRLIRPRRYFDNLLLLL